MRQLLCVSVLGLLAAAILARPNMWGERPGKEDLDVPTEGQAKAVAQGDTVQRQPMVRHDVALLSNESSIVMKRLIPSTPQIEFNLKLE